MIEATLLTALAFYAVMGLVTAVLFVTFGVSRVLDQGTTITRGARILWLPGAAALWPYVLLRWLRAGGVR
jgi:hypothetical protein